MNRTYRLVWNDATHRYVPAPETSRGLPDQADERIELAVTHMGFAASKAGARSVVEIIASRLAA